jgi:AcrR family transcriptional regulator
MPSYNLIKEMSEDTKSKIARRTPQSSRGEQRVNKILDAADALFAEIGYEATTTNAIAMRAETSIGSVYQFFASKEAILEALTKRYQTALRALYAETLHDGVTVSSFVPTVEKLIDGLADLHLNNPGFHAVFSDAPLSRTTPTHNLREVVVLRVQELLLRGAPQLPVEDARLHALVSVTIVKALLNLMDAQTSNINERQKIIAEMKKAVLAYLHPILS